MISLVMELEEAKMIYSAMKNHCLPPSDAQRVVYDFVHKLDHLITVEEGYAASDANKRDMDK